MNTLSRILRVAGYACGLLGLAAYVFGNRAGGAAWRAAGAGLLLTMFVAFLLNYALYAVGMIGRRARRDNADEP